MFFFPGFFQHADQIRGTSEGGVTPKCINEWDRQTVTNRQKDRQRQWNGTDLKQCLAADKWREEEEEGETFCFGKGEVKKGEWGDLKDLLMAHNSSFLALVPPPMLHYCTILPYFLSSSHLFPSSTFPFFPSTQPFSLSLPAIISARPLGRLVSMVISMRLITTDKSSCRVLRAWMTFLHSRKKGKHAVKLINGWTLCDFPSVWYRNVHSMCK